MGGAQTIKTIIPCITRLVTFSYAMPAKSRWPTVGATAKLPISGAFASRKPNTRQNMKSTTEKPSTKKAPSKARTHSTSISNNSGNDGHDETTEKSQSPSLPGRNHDHDTEQNATFMNDDTDQTTSISCSVCLMSSNSDDISCDICKAVCHVKCLPVPPKLHEHLKTLITNLGWVCCNVSPSRGIGRHVRCHYPRMPKQNSLLWSHDRGLHQF